MCMSNVSYRFLSDERVDSCYLQRKGNIPESKTIGKGEREGGEREKRRGGGGNARVRATRRSASRVEQ